jgi:lysozyme
MTYRATGPNSWQVPSVSSVVRRRKSRLGIVVLTALAAAALAALVFARHQRRPPAALPLPPGCPLGETASPGSPGRAALPQAVRRSTTAGVDVSYYQGDIAWPRVYRAGVRFAFIRAYDGTDVFDSKFLANWSGARDAKLLRGAYQFFRPELSATDQADLMIKLLRTHGMGELPLVLDVETTGGLSLDAVAHQARLWVERVRTELKVEPIVYTNFGMWRWRGAAELASQPLWLAHYTAQCPSVPPPWQRWTFWQYTDAGRVPGITGPVDLDVFDGTLAELRGRFAR